MVNSPASDSGLFAGSLSMPDFCYEHTHSSCSGRFYSYVNQFKSHAGRNPLSNENLNFCTALLHFWKCTPSFLSNPVLLNTDTSPHRQKHPFSAEDWGISQTSVCVGALSAFSHHGGNMQIFRNMETSPSFCGWGCWGSYNPFLWELLLRWASAAGPDVRHSSHHAWSVPASPQGCGCPRARGMLWQPDPTIMDLGTPQNSWNRSLGCPDRTL